MEEINELKIRELLTGEITRATLFTDCLQILANEDIEWAEKRGIWHFIYNTGQGLALVEALKFCLRKKQRVPFDLFLRLCAAAKLKPTRSLLESLLKGVRKQRAQEDLIAINGLEKWDERLANIREEYYCRKTRRRSRVQSRPYRKIYVFEKSADGRAGRARSWTVGATLP